MLSGGFRLWSGATWDLPRRNRFKVLTAGPEPGSNFERPGSPADSLFAADDDDGVGGDRVSPVGGDERVADADATATSDCREGSTTTTAEAVVAVVAAAAAAAAVADIDMDIGIGTATGTDIDIGDWTGVFGAALPGPEVPYRWDDMYHQKPGLAVCLHVQCSIRRSLVPIVS